MIDLGMLTQEETEQLLREVLQNLPEEAAINVIVSWASTIAGGKAELIGCLEV